jgi:hypothetical protein
MSGRDPKLPSRLLLGAIAGFCGTVVMTAAMRRLHRRLPQAERYPLPPREIVDSTARKAGRELGEEAAKDITTAAHFGYGAAAGSLIGAASPRVGPVAGAMAGVAVWVVSYLGWIPGAAILKPATLHPKRRNALMLVAHLAWGAGTALALRELAQARETMLAGGDDADAPASTRKPRTRP